MKFENSRLISDEDYTYHTLSKTIPIEHLQHYLLECELEKDYLEDILADRGIEYPTGDNIVVKTTDEEKAVAKRRLKDRHRVSAVLKALIEGTL